MERAEVEIHIPSWVADIATAVQVGEMWAPVIVAHDLDANERIASSRVPENGVWPITDRHLSVSAGYPAAVEPVAWSGLMTSPLDAGGYALLQAGPLKLFAEGRVVERGWSDAAVLVQIPHASDDLSPTLDLPRGRVKAIERILGSARPQPDGEAPIVWDAHASKVATTAIDWDPARGEIVSFSVRVVFDGEPWAESILRKEV